MPKCKDCAYKGKDNERRYCRCRGQYKELPVYYCSWYESKEDFKKRNKLK